MTLRCIDPNEKILRPLSRAESYTSCPQCGEDAGDFCRRPDDTICKAPHRKRLRLVKSGRRIRD